MLLHSPDLIPMVKEKKVFDAFFSHYLRGLGEKIVQTASDSDNFITAVMARLEETDQDLIARLAMEDFSDTEDLSKTAAVLMDRIIKIKNKNDSPLVNKILKAKKGCDADVMDLLKQKQQEIQQLHNC